MKNKKVRFTKQIKVNSEKEVEKKEEKKEVKKKRKTKYHDKDPETD